MKIRVTVTVNGVSRRATWNQDARVLDDAHHMNREDWIKKRAVEAYHDALAAKVGP